MNSKTARDAMRYVSREDDAAFLRSVGEDDEPDIDPQPAPCANCGERVEPDDGGAIWYHADNMSMFCDGDDSTDLSRQAEPATTDQDRTDADNVLRRVAELVAATPSTPDSPHDYAAGYAAAMDEVRAILGGL